LSAQEDIMFHVMEAGPNANSVVMQFEGIHLTISKSTPSIEVLYGI